MVSFILKIDCVFYGNAMSVVLREALVKVDLMLVLVMRSQEPLNFAELQACASSTVTSQKPNKY